MKSVEALIEATPPGMPTAIDFMQAFYGFNTIRIDGQPAKSKTYIDARFRDGPHQCAQCGFRLETYR